MNIKTRITKLFGIEYPVIQAGMVWVSGWKLASAVSKTGGLGLIGAGSMKPELLREHINKCRKATKNPFGVNIPLLREDASELVNSAVEEGVKIVFTSAGNPKKFISELKKNEVTCVHVVSSLRQGLKAQEAGYDAVVGEGVEAGGHNGMAQTTTFCLIPLLSSRLDIPVIAAGGITDGVGILAALSLGAEGVQIGTRFAASHESSAHPNYKRKIIDADETSTTLAFARIGLVRMLKNEFAMKALKAEHEGWDEVQLRELLGKKRERMGIFEGNEVEGQMEAGQGVSLISEILSVEEIFRKLIGEYNSALERITGYSKSDV